MIAADYQRQQFAVKSGLNIYGYREIGTSEYTLNVLINYARTRMSFLCTQYNIYVC